MNRREFFQFLSEELHRRVFAGTIARLTRFIATGIIALTIGSLVLLLGDGLLQYCSLRYAAWRGIESPWAFHGHTLNGAKLDHLNLTGAHMSDVSMVGVVLKHVDFTGAGLSFCDLSHSTFSDVSFQGAHLNLADLSHCMMHGVNMRGADEKETRLEYTVFRDVDLSGAQLQGACLVHADMSGARLDRANLAGAYYDLTTRWPAGVDPRRLGAALVVSGLCGSRYGPFRP